MVAIQFVSVARLEEEGALRVRKARKMNGTDQAREVSTRIGKVGMRPWNGRGLAQGMGNRGGCRSSGGRCRGASVLGAGACPCTGDGAKLLSP